jgi:hypothetical protein
LEGEALLFTRNPMITSDSLLRITKKLKG